MPQAIIKIAELIPALEAVTGADMLISPLRKPKLEWITDALPHQLILRKHCQAGRQEDCKECTKAFHNHLRKLAGDEGDVHQNSYVHDSVNEEAAEQIAEDNAE